MLNEDARRIEGRFLAFTLIAFAVLGFFVLKTYLYYVIGGLLLVFAFFPIHRRIRKHVRRKAPAAFLSFLLVILVVIGPLILVGFMVFNSAANFAATFDPNKINETLQPILEKYGIDRPDGNETNATEPGDVANFLARSVKRFADRVGAELLAAAPGLAVGLVISGFVIYYGFEDGEAFYSRLRHALPLPDEIEEPLFREVARVTQVVFVGNILVSVLGGVVGAISFFVFGLPNAVFWGFVMIILGILPVVGAPLVWGPAAAFLFLDGRPFAAIGVLIINGVIVIGYIDNILRPKLIGKFSNVHPVLILIGVLGGVEAFGALGFVVGPLVLAIFIALVRAYMEWHPRWKQRRESGEERYHPAAVIEVVESKPPPPPPAATPSAQPGPDLPDPDASPEPDEHPA